jgi:hypothetical protein
MQKRGSTVTLAPSNDNSDARPSVPSVSPVLRDVAGTVQASHCTFSPHAVLWAGPRWDRRLDLEANLARQWPVLRRFTEVFTTARLDAFVIAPVLKKPVRTVEELGRLVRDILICLSDADPAGDDSMASLLLSPGWQFSFNGVTMFVTTFSDLYPADHVRHSGDGTFLMLQPTESFDMHGIGSRHPHSAEIKSSVRENFERHNQIYPLDAIERRIEAHLYVLPLNGQPPIAWWEPDARHGQVVLF